METPILPIPPPPARLAGRTLAACSRLVAFGALALVTASAQAGSLAVRDSDGRQWRALEDPADDAQGYVLERRGADGSLDERFGHGGRRPLVISAANDAPTGMRVDSRSRIWVVGASIAGGQPQAVVERYLPEGVPDLQWGLQGKVQLSPGGIAVKPNDLMPLSDGSVLVAGVAANLEPSRAVVFHLRANGALDTAFGSAGTWQRAGASDGSTATSLGASRTGAVAVAVAVHGDNAVAEVWSLNDVPPRRMLQQPLDDASDSEDLRVGWSGDRWVLGTGAAPTVAGMPATLDPHPALADAAVGPAASAPSDPGQGGFSPFAGEPAAAPHMAQDPPESELPWVRIGIATALLCVVVGMLFARGRGTNEALRPGKGPR